MRPARRAEPTALVALLLALPASAWAQASPALDPQAPAPTPASTSTPARASTPLASLWPDSLVPVAYVSPVRSSPTFRPLGGPAGVPAARAAIAARAEVAGVTAMRQGPLWMGGRATGILSFAAAGGPVFEVRTQALTTRRPEPPGSGGLRTEALARFGEGPFRFSLGAGLERDLDTEGSPTRGVFSLGIARQLRDVAMDLRLEQSRRSVRVTSLAAFDSIPGDSIEPVPFPVEGAEDVSTVSARFGTRWQRGRWMLESAAGMLLHRFAAPRGWAQSSVSLGLGPDLALCATVGGAAPRWLSLEPAAERCASLGLRLSPGLFPAMSPEPAERPPGPTWRLIRAPRGWTVIQVRAPGAERVEVIGDFTGWQSMSLRRVGGSRWELGLTLEPGVHRVNVRVDGGPWTPPAGLPTTADGFDGVAGVIVIE